MKIRLSATFTGKCDLCGKKTTVFSLGDEDSKKVLTICKDCCEKLGNMQAGQAVENYGRKNEEAFREGIRIEKPNDH